MTRLRPKTEAAHLDIEELVVIADAEFGFVHCDPDAGLRFAAARLLESRACSTHDEKDEAMAKVANSLMMVVGDDQSSDEYFLICFAIPNQDLVIDYAYDSHALKVEPLLRRLAKSLNYEIVSE